MSEIVRKEVVDEDGRIWDHWILPDGTDSMAPIPQFKVGEWAWYITQSWAPLLVKVQIDEVETWAREKNDTAFIWYMFDEPIGHGLDADEFFMLQEYDVALEEFAKHYKDLAKRLGAEKVKRDGSLEFYRQKTQEFIAKTWEGEHPGFAPLPGKELDVEYFNVDSLLDENGDPTPEASIKLMAASLQ